MQDGGKKRGGENFILQKDERRFLSLSENRDSPGNKGSETLGLT